MSRTLIYIENELVDLLPDTIIAYTFKALEVGSLTTRNANYTNQIKLPETAGNRRIFQHSQQIKSLSTRPYSLLSVKVVQSGLEIIPNGAAELAEVDNGFSLNIFSGPFDFFQVIAEEFINALDYSAFDALGKWSKSVADGLRNATSGVVSPVIQFGVNLRDSAGTIFNTLEVSGIEYSLPCFYYKTILDKIITEAGYTYDGDIFSDSKFLSLIVPAGNTTNPGNYSAAFYDARNVRASAAGGQTIVNPGSPAHTQIEFTEVSFNGSKNYYNGVDAYQRDGSQEDNFMINIYVWLDITVTGAGGTVRLAITQNGLNIQGISSSAGTGIYEIEFQVSADTIALDELGVGVSTDVNPATCVINAAVLRIETSGDPFDRYGITWTNDHIQIYSEVLPAVKKKEFMRDFMVRFGQIVKEKNGMLYFKGIDEIIADRAGAADWTDKRDRSKPQRLRFIKDTLGQTNALEYSVTDEILTDNYTGRGTFAVPNANLEAEKTDTSIFSSSQSSGSDVGIMSAIVKVWDDTTDSDYDNDPGFRLLAVRDKASSEPSVKWDATARSDYKVAYFDDPRYGSCSFQSFLDAYYPKYISALQKLKIVERYYMLSTMDAVAFDPFQLVYDSGDYFIVNTISNFVPGQVTKVELFKVS